MGTGGSFLRSQDDDDILGPDYDGSSQGVIKRIPIEMKPRGRLGLRSVGSFGRKSKGGSLRSALSVDLENTEVEKIRKEFEMYRLNKENEIGNLQKKQSKLETENKRLRAELLALQKTCMKLRGETDSAYEAEHQALARAGTFETERDKVQRQFKLFRETKEKEIQNLLRARRELENKLTKIAHGYLPDDTDSVSRAGLDSTIGNANPGDWWTALESEPSLGSTTQLHPPVVRGPELAHSLMEMEGPFTNVNKDDWSSALANMSTVVASIPDHILSSTIRLYISASADMQTELDILRKEYFSKLSELCEMEARTLLVVHIPSDESEHANNQMMLERQAAARKTQVDMCSIFLGMLGETCHRYMEAEFDHGYLCNPGVKQAVFCFRNSTFKGQKSNNSVAVDLKASVRRISHARIVDGHNLPSRGAEQVYTELDKILRAELHVDSKRDKSDSDSGFSDSDGPENLCGGSMWDIHCEYEQLEALNSAVQSTCELGFERYYERLNAHVSAPGPLPPLLVMGSGGSGRSLLLGKWINLQQEKYPGSLVFYQFVGAESSVSADPIVMIRRLTAQLMQHVSSPPALTCDPVRLVEEFPKWLEKVSSKSPGGAILVLDAIDRFQQAEQHLKWLLDPLPVDIRVIVSVQVDTCPQTWCAWPTINLDPLSNKNVKELLHADLAAMGDTLSPEAETQILTHCRTPHTCNPLYVMVLARAIAGCLHKDLNQFGQHLDTLLTSIDVVSLYGQVIDATRAEYETHETRGLLKKILSYLSVCRNGLKESELMALLPGVTWSYWAPMFSALSDQLVIKYSSGIVSLAHQQVGNAVQSLYFSKDKDKLTVQLRQHLIDYFSQFLTPGTVTCRVADELPWLLRQTGDKEALRSCLLNLCIFQKLYARGRCSEMISCWQFVGSDKNSMAQAYFNATRKIEEMVGHYNGLVTFPRIANMYECLGRLLKDLGLLTQALPSLQRALEIRETAMDPDHPLVARSLHQLAGLHAQWGKFVTAEALYRQALDIYENAFGADHNLVAKELDALAVLYQKQDKHDLAEPLKRRAMSIRKKTRTPRMNSGQTRGVDALQKRALQLEELAMGPDSPDLARTLNELGVLYYLQNNIETAESFFKRSLEMRESVLGPDHLDVAQSLNNLAALYNDKKQYSKAEPLYDRSLHIRLEFLSPDNPSVASVIKNLAMVYKRQGKFELAEPLYKQAVDIREQSFGPHHPAVATALVNLAVLFSQQNKYNDAEPLYERALKIYENSFGPQHPRVAETLRNRAVMKYEQGDYETAAKLYKRATEIKDSDAHYPGKESSRRSSSGDTNSTMKYIHA